MGVFGGLSAKESREWSSKIIDSKTRQSLFGLSLLIGPCKTQSLLDDLFKNIHHTVLARELLQLNKI